ncbi:hypothetical protein [Corynebacterium uterequi]|uniref:Uncharacterized protein n=1 Tax=Corynebacterium uterequi TaxID=1072256 RepID=A0A0G3HG31_9CORY|nr:hypothetical protein [Corynebacterium uterequi]AKK11690.1 hypothetical protein CUTER_08540 [Corynebacterium uterequi]
MHLGATDLLSLGSTVCVAVFGLWQVWLKVHSDQSIAESRRETEALPSWAEFAEQVEAHWQRRVSGLESQLEEVRGDLEALRAENQALRIENAQLRKINAELLDKLGG